MKETELAQHFVDYLSCYDLYFEVECSSGRVDILSLSGNIRTAYEVKTSFNFKVLEQAFNNQEYFHYSFIAVPYFKDNYFQKKICRDYGVGLLVCNANLWMHGNVDELVKPKLNRHPTDAIRNPLNDSYKKSLPGSSGASSERITPFKITVENVTRYVKHHPGCSLKDVFASIEHHYSSNAGARSSTYHWIQSGLIKDIRMDHGKLYFEPIAIDSQISQPTNPQ